MTARLVPLLLAAALAAPAGAAVPIDVLEVEMRPLDAKVLFRKDPYDKSSFPVTVKGEGGQQLEGRIEVKGSFTRSVGKKSVLIKLADGKWKGQGRISLNGMGTDGTMMREWLAWDLMRALKMVGPGNRYTRLNVNGVDQGLFLRFDWIDTRMLDKAGQGADGELYHPYDSAFCGDLTPASLLPRRECWLKFAPFDNDFASLGALIEEIHAEPVDTFHRFLDRRFDAESVINWFAVNALVTESDTYNKNYFLYLSRKTGKWLVVPWDYDLTFGRGFDPFRKFPYTILNDHFQYYFPIETGQSNPLQYGALKNATLRGRVLDRLRELTRGAPDAARPWRGWFAPARMQQRLSELREVVLPELRRDPFMAAAEGKFEDELASLRFYARARVAYLRQVAFGEGTSVLRDHGSARLDADGADVVDAWGQVLAFADGASGGTLRVEARRGWPELVPPGVDRASCVQRSWLLTSDNGAPLDLTLAYVDENSHLREPGPAVADERALKLHARGPGGWRALPTRVAPVANALTARDVRVPRGEPLRVVACAPAAAAAATAAP